MKNLFIGIEETNILDFRSKCCDAYLSIEPLCRVCCGICGEDMYPHSENEIYHAEVDKKRENKSAGNVCPIDNQRPDPIGCP